MSNSAQIKTQLDAANAEAARLAQQLFRSGKGPSAEYKAAYAKAYTLWQQYSNALDIEEGRKPAFDVPILNP